MSGFLLINKPKGPTSFDIIRQLRKTTGIKKIGHAGTLDPNATGLLIVGVGRQATKKLSKLTNKTSKTYIAELFLGEERDTDDPEGKVVKTYKVDKKPTKTQVKNTLKKFQGEIYQTPPIFSAIKKGGKKAYTLARKGQDPKLEKRKITVKNIKLLNYSYPTLNLEITASSGTYIRAIARDIGRDLGTGAYLKNLKRTQIGKFSISDSVKPNKLNKNNWEKYLISEV